RPSCPWCRSSSQSSITEPPGRVTRTLRPSCSTRNPTRVGLSVFGSISIRFETWIGASTSTIPPGWPIPRGLVCLVTRLTPCTTARSARGMTCVTSPRWPLFAPLITCTRSPLRIRAAISQHLRRQRDDLHEPARAQLAHHRAEDAGADRLLLLVDQHRGVAVEANRAAVRPSHREGGAHDHRLVHVALLHLAARDGVLHRHHDDIADRGGLPLGTAQHLDALHPPCAGIVGDVQVGLDRDHLPIPSELVKQSNLRKNAR